MDVIQPKPEEVELPRKVRFSKPGHKYDYPMQVVAPDPADAEQAQRVTRFLNWAIQNDVIGAGHV